MHICIYCGKSHNVNSPYCSAKCRLALNKFCNKYREFNWIDQSKEEGTILIKCPHCGKEHWIKFWEDIATADPMNFLAFLCPDCKKLDPKSIKMTDAEFDRLLDERLRSMSVYRSALQREEREQNKALKQQALEKKRARALEEKRLRDQARIKQAAEIRLRAEQRERDRALKKQLDSAKQEERRKKLSSNPLCYEHPEVRQWLIRHPELISEIPDKYVSLFFYAIISNTPWHKIPYIDLGTTPERAEKIVTTVFKYYTSAYSYLIRSNVDPKKYIVDTYITFVMNGRLMAKVKYNPIKGVKITLPEHQLFLDPSLMDIIHECNIPYQIVYNRGTAFTVFKLKNYEHLPISSKYSEFSILRQAVRTKSKSGKRV